ncbi:Imm1 family immunity protein [Streptomyces sp. NPDC050095]|uniref:Imm1 family immunity protein n=1 Tax=unclassified Streptomyces TaxID=2593676 RepID=UPI00342ACC78
MALKVLGCDPVYLETEGEVRGYLDALFDAAVAAKSYADVHFQFVEDASVDRGTHGVMSWPDNVLVVGLDYPSGYGGLIWWCEGRFADRVREELGTDVADSAWVSLNPTPPESDPKVLSDPSTPYFFDRVSVLSLHIVRAAVEEYFREGTGFRPKGVEWVKGHFTGELYEDV